MLPVALYPPWSDPVREKAAASRCCRFWPSGCRGKEQQDRSRRQAPMARNAIANERRPFCCQRVAARGSLLVHRSELVPSLSTPHSEPAMPLVKARACTILGELEQAQTELIGKAVILTDGKAGTVESVSLDELHGLRISISGHDGKWPVSTIKFAEPGLRRYK